MQTKPVSKETIDCWADTASGPVALYLKEKLLPLEGDGAVIFPPTYANIDYNLDPLQDGSQVVTIDSVGAQANRIEPMFSLNSEGIPGMAALVPQIDIEYAADKIISIFETGHRLGDAIVRCSELKDEARAAFHLYLTDGDASQLARLAPTSLIFGVWDSRDTQAKFPRIIQSVIRAWDVEKLRRSAQYNPAIDYSALQVFTDDERQKDEGDPKSPLARGGFVHVPATGAPGGVIARGPIERQVTLNLLALRRLRGDKAQELRRYLLGLALVAAAAPFDGFLRQGCLLTLDPAVTPQWEAVGRDGKREPVILNFEELIAYTVRARDAFGISESRKVKFSRDLAKLEVAEWKKKAAKKEKAVK